LELDKLYNYSSFLKQYQYLNNQLDVNHISIKSILEHFHKFNFLTPDKNIQTFKNELIYLIFIAIHTQQLSQIDGSRLWSILCKKILIKLFNNFLSDHGETNYQNSYFVLGLGKIGVSDLNFASDIDIIIFFDSKKSSTPIVQFNQLIKRFISEISDISENFFHKIDLRLRPDLGNSFIITDIEDAINYYSSVGRNWERLAYHRSSFICGNRTLYWYFKDSIKSFLFRRSFDFYAIDEIKKLFSDKKHKNENNIKDSYGYIRSCENIIHFNQLLWSGKIQSFQISNIHKILNKFKEYPSIINPEVLEIVTNSYYFFRKFENYLHIKLNSFQNSIPKNDHNLNSVFPFYIDLLNQQREQSIKIFEMLFNPGEESKDLKVDEFNEKSKSIIQKLTDRARKINSSDTVKKDFLNTVHYLVNALKPTENRDDLIIKFDYLINYYKSGVHLSALYKYNPKIFLEIIKIFQISERLTKQLYKNNYLIESLVYLFNYGLPNLKLRKKTDNLDLDIKKLIQDFYEIVFLIDYLYISEKFEHSQYLIKRNLTIKKFILILFEFVKTDYLESRKNVYSDLTPLLFGSLAINNSIPSSDVDLFFVYFKPENSHIDNIKIVRRFYNIVDQYIDKDFLNIDNRNKPFDKSSDQVINFTNFFEFYINTDEPFHKLSFLKTYLLTTQIRLHHLFQTKKNETINQFQLLDLEYVLKIYEIKKPDEILKDLFQLFEITRDIFKINKQKFPYIQELKDLRFKMLSEDLGGSFSLVDQKSYLEKLRSLIKF